MVIASSPAVSCAVSSRAPSRPSPSGGFWGSQGCTGGRVGCATNSCGAGREVPRVDPCLRAARQCDAPGDEKAVGPVVAGVRSAAAALGLVPSSGTSQTRGVEPDFLVDAGIARLARMKKSVRAAVRAVEEVALGGARGVRPWLVTLTYAKTDAWSGRHVSAFLDCMVKWGRRQGFSVPYVWVAEMQKRSAVHYHVIVWLPCRMSMPKPDKRGWWRHGMSNCVRARRAVGYLVKYTSKGDAGVFPRGLRLAGYGGLTREGRAVRYWLCLPGWLSRRVGTFQRVTRLRGGVWLIEETGELCRSAWQFVSIVDGVLRFRRRDARATVKTFGSGAREFGNIQLQASYEGLTEEEER